MSLENTSDYSYRFGYTVCAVFLLCFILMTCAVVNGALQRSELEQVVSQVVPQAVSREQCQEREAKS
jgi:hypothetical protein